MALRYHVPLPGPFYYSGRVGPKHWLPRNRTRSTVICDKTAKWLFIYPSIALFGAGLAILLAPFYGLFWLVRRSLRNRQKCQPVAQRFPVQRPRGFVPAQRPGQPAPYGFVPAQRPGQPVPYGFVPAQRPVPAPAYAPSRSAVAR